MKDEKKTLFLMGTVIQMQVEHQKANIILEEAQARLIDFEKRFSANDVQSELMKINKNAGLQSVKVALDLFELIEVGTFESKIEDSFLNIAIGPLVKEWRIGFKDANKPSNAKIKNRLKLINPEKIVLDADTQSVYLSEKAMALDLGGLAKGYFADKIIHFFQQQGATSGFIDLGGNVRTFGKSKKQADGKWRVGIQNPFLSRGNYVAVLKINNQSVVTSGVYERKLEWQGKHYHHIFDSKTGYPIETDMLSLTIVSDESLIGEIWTKRLFGKTAKEALEIINQTLGIEGIVITASGEIAFSQQLQQFMG